MFFVVSICVILDLAVASPVLNIEHVRMASPSHVRRADIPTSQFYNDHTILNVPIPELINKMPPFDPPQILNPPTNTVSGTHQTANLNAVLNLNEKGTKYLQNLYQNPSVLSSQQSGSEIYQNGGGNIQTPIQRLQELYQESSTLQKLLSNLNLIRNILAPKPQKKQFILVYPNGTIGYEDNLSIISNKYPNHIILKSSELRKLTNVGNEIENGSDHPQPQENIQNISSSTTQSNTNNQIFDTNQSNSKSIVVNNNIESKNNIEETNTEVIDTTINKTQNNSVIQNTLNDSASKISQLEKSENLAYNTNNTTTAIHNISDSNENVGGIDTLNITGKDITLTEDKENISNAYNIPNLQNTTINKVDEVANTELSVLTNENQISINFNTEPLNNITSENSYGSEDIANSSYATNEFDNEQTTEYNTTHDSDYDEIVSNNQSSSPVVNNTNKNEDLTTVTNINIQNDTESKDYKNISNYNIKNLQNTTINKVDEVANTELSVLTNENQISINFNTEPLNNITSENSYSSEDIANSSYATNEFDNEQTTEYNTTHDSDYDEIVSNNQSSSPVVNNTNKNEDLTTVTNINIQNDTESKGITNEEHINNSTAGNVTSDCQCCEEEIVNDEGTIKGELALSEDNIKLNAPDSVSWVQLAKESAKNMLFGEDNPNVFFIFYNPPEMDVERETRTTTYPNGTVVEEYIEIRKVDGTTIRTSTTKTYNSSSTIPLTTNG